MTAEPVELSELIAVRERLIHELQHALDADERKFLISFVRNQPDWSLLGIPHLAELPSIRWNLLNLPVSQTQPQEVCEASRSARKTAGELMECTGRPVWLFIC
jgi:hypothetical protein